MASRRTKDREQSDYNKYLKYQGAGFALAATDKTFVWWPNTGEDAENKAYSQVEVLKDNEKDFTVQLEDGSTKTLPKNEKNYLGVNGAKFDGVEDMGELGHLNEPSVLHNLKKRYEKDLFHTYSGLFLVVVNPYKRMPIYTTEIVDIYRGKPREKVAPHIFAMSDVAYRAMLQEQKNQSMLITGESGAGKTENTKKVIQYLTTIAGRSGDTILEEQLLEFNPILEAFGNAKTVKNNNSSRFGKFIELQFNSGGQIAGANTRIYLLEKSRVVAVSAEERNFHVFYQIMTLPAETKAKLHLTKAEDFKFLIHHEKPCTVVEGVNESEELAHSIDALHTLHVQDSDIENVWETLAAILHLGNLPFTETSRDVADLADEISLGHAAEHLGVDPKKLRQGLLTPSLAGLGAEITYKSLNKFKAIANRDALCKALYGNLFLWIVKKINEELSHPEEQSLFIGVLDISGFEIFQNNSFEQLCINYTNEKLQQFFNHHMFTLEQEEYEREKIDWVFVDYGLDLQDTIDLIEKESYGILAILEDECLIPEANDTSFTKKLHGKHDAHRSFRKPRFTENSFKIIHYAGIVNYQTSEWIDKNRDPLENDLKELLKRSSKGFLRGLFDEKIVTANLPQSPMTPVGRGGQVRRPKAAAFNYVSRYYKEQLHHLMEVLRSTSPHFIRCIIPNILKRPLVVQDKLVLDQMKCNGVLEGIRIARKGWPNRIRFADFVKRYYLLKPGTDPKTTQTKEISKEITNYLVKTYPAKVTDETIRHGVTKIFFRAGQLAIIENLREQVISGMVVAFQSATRAFLARREYNKMREQEIAAKTIQRNLRAYLELTESLWWKMYVAGRPLINRRDFLKEIEELNRKFKTLEKELSDTNAEIETLSKEKATGDAELQKLEKQSDELSARQKALSSEIANLKREHETLKEKLDSTEEALKEEEASGSALSKEKSELERIRAELEQTLTDQKIRTKELEDAKRKAEDERDDCEDKVDDERDKIIQLNKKIADIQHSLDEATNRATDQENLGESLRNKLKNLEKNLVAAKETYSTESTDKAALDKLKKELQVDLETATQALVDAKTRAENAKNQSKRITTQLEDVNAQLEDVKGKLSRSEKSAKDLKSKVTETEDLLEEESEGRANLDKQKKASESRADELAGTIRSQEGAKNAAAEQAKTLKNQLDDVNRRLEETDALITRFKQEKKSALDEQADLEEQLEQEREASKKEKKRLATKIQELTTAIDNAPKGDAKSEDINRLEEQIKEVQEQTEAANAAKQRAEEAASANNAIIDEVRAKLSEVSQSNKGLVEKNRETKDDIDKMNRELSTQEDLRALLEATNRRLNNEVDNLKRKASLLSSDKNKGFEVYGHYKTENEGLKKAIGDFEKDNRNLYRDVKALKARLEEVLHQIDLERSAKQRLTTSAEVLKKLIIDRSVSNGELVSELKSSYDLEKASMEAQITQLEDRRKRLTEQLASS